MKLDQIIEHVVDHHAAIIRRVATYVYDCLDHKQQDTLEQLMGCRVPNDYDDLEDVIDELDPDVLMQMVQVINNRDLSRITADYYS